MFEKGPRGFLTDAIHALIECRKHGYPKLLEEGTHGVKW
jgi:hypothetical protein